MRRKSNEFLLRIARQILAVFCVVAIAPVVLAQTSSGTITGRVLDSTGAAIAGAAVTATDTDTGIQTKSITTSAGIYELSTLKPGPYSIQAEAAGFKKLLRAGIVVQIEDHIGMDLRLEIGNVSESVIVTTETPLLRTEDAQTGEVIDYQMIQDVPQYSRDPLTLLTLSGNVQGSGARADGGSGSDTRINGGRTSSIDYLVDGITLVSGQSHNANAENPGNDDVQEFKVITNGVPADIGRVSGGVVTMVTKAGTNNLHGQVYEYYQNAALDDSGWLQKSLGGKKTPFHNFDTGFAGGGPIFVPKVYNGRDKTFFYATYEGTRKYTSGQLHITQFPTDAEKSGDLSGMYLPSPDGNSTVHMGAPGYQMFTPCYSPGDPGYQPGLCSASPVATPSGLPTYTPGKPGIQKYVPLGGDGAHIPSNLISPISAAILKTLPEPNHTPIAGYSDAGNYVGAQNTTNSTDVWSLRIDHQFTPNSHLYGRYTHNNSSGGSTVWTAPNIQPVNGYFIPGGYGLAVNYDYVFNPTLSMNIVAGGYYSPYTSGQFLPAGWNTTKDIGFSGILAQLANGNNLDNDPGFELSPASERFDWGYPANSVQANNTTAQAGGSVTKVLSRHVLKFGSETRRYYDNTSNAATGFMIFDGDPLTQYSYDVGTGNSFANMTGMGGFLLGITDFGGQNGPSSRLLAANYYAAYAEDSFKVNSRLTLELGLRWDMESPTTERHNRLYMWDQKAPAPFAMDAGWNWQNTLSSLSWELTPNQISQIQTPSWVTGGFHTGAIRIANTPEHPSRYAGSYHPFQFAPRLGGAFKLNEKTVLRASVGLMYLPTTGDPNGYTSPSVSLNGGAAQGWQQSNFGVNPDQSNWTNPYFPSEVSSYVRTNAQANLQSSGQNLGAGGLSTTIHMPHEYDWNIGIQRELPKGFLLEANYSGNASNSLLAIDEISRFPKNLFVPANASLYSTPFAKPPTQGESNQFGVGWPLGLLEYPYPYFGPVTVSGRNIGKANFESLNLRLEKRFSQGLQLLFNYSYSNARDNVGGPEANPGNGPVSASGTGGRIIQSVDTVRDIYGVSPLDETHRISSFYLYQLPVGRGRRWMTNPSGAGGKMLDSAIGGWAISGTVSYHSGTPVSFSFSNTQVNNSPNLISQTYGSCTWTCTNRDLISPAFKGAKSVLASSSSSNTAVSAFNYPAFTESQAFKYGNMPPTYSAFRNPGDFMSDMSLMKQFPILSADGKRYLQFRAEAANVFNIAGLSGYNTQLDGPGFGTITNVANTERHIQMSAKFVF